MRCSLCRCAGHWSENQFKPNEEVIQSIKLCTDCGRQINPKRVEVQPQAAWCIDCAEEHIGGRANRRIDEPLGRREDYLRDRAGFKTLGREL